MLAFAMIGCAVMVLVALASGYRPVVITSGSMGDAAPTGALVVAAPQPAADVVVGDIIVMSRPDSAPITHRVVAIEQSVIGASATTRGDANPSDDPVPYRLGDEEMVARWVVPHAGAVLEAIRDPRLVLMVLSVVTMIATVVALRRLWTAPGRVDADLSDPSPSPGQRAPHAGECDSTFEGVDGADNCDGTVAANDPGTGAVVALASVPVPSGSKDAEFSRSAGKPMVAVRHPSTVFGRGTDRQIPGGAPTPWAASQTTAAASTRLDQGDIT
jgi:signal peptidase